MSYYVDQWLNGKSKYKQLRYMHTSLSGKLVETMDFVDSTYHIFNLFQRPTNRYINQLRKAPTKYLIYLHGYIFLDCFTCSLCIKSQ